MREYENMMQGSTSPTQQGFTPRQLPVTVRNNNQINNNNNHNNRKNHNNRIDLSLDYNGIRFIEWFQCVA